MELLLCLVFLAGFVAEMVLRIADSLWLRSRRSRRPSMMEQAASSSAVCAAAVETEEKIFLPALFRAVVRMGKSRFSRLRLRGSTVAESPETVVPRVLTVAAEGDLSAAISRQLAAEIGCPFGEGESRFRVAVVRGAGGDGVVVACCGVFFDSRSAMELLRRVLILAKEPAADFGEEDNVESADDLLLLPSFVFGYYFQLAFTAIELLRETHVLTLLWASPSTTEAKKKISSSLLLRRFDEETTKRLMVSARSQRGGVTLGNAVAAAGMQALDIEDNLWCAVQADLRSNDKGDENSFVFGNLSPVISITRSSHQLRGSFWGLAASLQREAATWTLLRLTAAYYLFYSNLSQLIVPLIGKLVVRRLGSSLVPDPQLTVANLGVVVAEDDYNSSRQPHWSAADVERMPQIKSFSAATASAADLTVGWWTFRGRLSLCANFSCSAMTMDQANSFMDRLVDNLGATPGKPS